MNIPAVPASSSGVNEEIEFNEETPEALASGCENTAAPEQSENAVPVTSEHSALSAINTIVVLFAEFFRSVYNYREYLKQSVLRDLRKKYKRSVLGYLWSMLSPLFMLIILALVFSHIMKQGIENYAVFLFAGMLAWGYFETTCFAALGAIRGNAHIIDQLPVPKFVFVVSSAFYNLVNFFLSLVPLLLVMLVTGHRISPSILLIPLVLLPLILFSLGVASLIAVSNVFFEDTEHLIGISLRALYFLCPILYARDMLPANLVQWLALNPLFSIIEDMRSLIYYGSFPDPFSYAYSCIGAVLVLGLGLWVFQRADNKFIYYI